MKTLLLVSAFIIILVLWFSSAYVIVYYLFPASEYDWATRGQFGSMFGAVNSLFSGLAFTAIIITVYLQYRALKEQGKILSKQNELMNIQIKRESYLKLPQIASSRGFYSGYVKSIDVYNYGERIVNIDIKAKLLAKWIKIRPIKVHVLNKDDSFQLNIETSQVDNFPPIELEFHFTNTLGERDSVEFYIQEGKNLELARIYDYNKLSIKN